MAGQYVAPEVAFFPLDEWYVKRTEKGWALYLRKCPHRPGDPACDCRPVHTRGAHIDGDGRGLS